MSQVEKLGERIRFLFKDTFMEISDLTDKNTVDAAHIVLNDELHKKPLEFENAVVRNISVSGDNIKHAISDYVRNGSVYDRNEGISDLLLEGLSYRIDVEIMPKVSLDRVSYLDTLKVLDRSLSSLGKFSYQDPFLATSSWSDSIAYRNREDLVRPFTTESKDGHEFYGDLVIAEKGQNGTFDFPRLGRYKAPSVISNMYQEPAKSSHIETLLKVVDSLYNGFNKL